MMAAEQPLRADGGWAPSPGPDEHVQRRPPFERLLLETTSHVVGAPIIALSVDESVGSGVRVGRAHDVGVVAVARLPHRSRIRMAALGRTLIIFQESPDSLDGEVCEPRRAELIRLLAETYVLRDAAGTLQHAIERARFLLAQPAPRSVFRDEFELTEELRDAARQYTEDGGPMRTLLRSVVIERAVRLAFLRTSTWPTAIHRSIESIASHDALLAARLTRAVEGDDTVLDEVTQGLLSPVSAIRYGRQTRVAGVGRAEPEYTERAPVANAQALQPAALARLSEDAVTSIARADLESMSKLQLLTIRWVHGAVLTEMQRRCIVARLHF